MRVAMRRSVASGLAGAAAAVVLASAALAQQPTSVVPTSPAQLKVSFAPVVKKAQPAVVNVYASRIERTPENPLVEDPVFRHFFGLDRGNGDRPTGRTERSLGSGVIVDAAGLVVTNHHVIEGMTDVKVALADKREFEAEIVLRDPRTDLAVLRLKGGSNFPVLELGDSDALEVGDFVLAIGDPFGVGQTVTQGIVSALARTQVGVSDYQFFIQTDAAINPGNSGGALVDTNARLVGINSSILSRSGGSMGIGFAIPVNMVKVVVAAAKGGSSKVRRPWLGATLQTVSADIADSIGLPRPAGALIANILDKSPASDGGLKRGDVITAVDGQPVDDPEGFGFRLATKPLGGIASLTVLREGKSLIVPLKLMAAPEVPPRDPVKLKNRSPFSGATVINLSPAVIEEFSLTSARQGVVVSDVEEGSTAAEVGLQKGDVVVAVNDDRIDSSRDLAKVTSGHGNYWKLVIQRGNQVLTTVFGG
ncbi:MAG: DegQ family serine endoprotease [Methylobacteriaceae bacterium]|nr:DegQ family serine endoprotease [Methylobacteriaceae bacterium]